MARWLEGVVLLLAVSAVACGKAPGSKPASGTKEEVEIAPGQFLTLERWDQSVKQSYTGVSGHEKTWLSIPYRGAIVEWEGEPIPVSLREYEERLYLIGYDREGARRQPAWGSRPVPLRYYRQEGAQLVEIPPAQFPKRIATQNMWVRSPEEIDEQVHLNTRSAGFQGSPTADAWFELMTGRRPTNKYVDREILDEYVRRFDPIKLTVIRRTTPATAPAGGGNGATSRGT
jgi:hypothetical protein